MSTVSVIGAVSVAGAKAIAKIVTKAVTARTLAATVSREDRRVAALLPITTANPCGHS
jgi:hypothetical protein